MKKLSLVAALLFAFGTFTFAQTPAATTAPAKKAATAKADKKAPAKKAASKSMAKKAAAPAAATDKK